MEDLLWPPDLQGPYDPPDLPGRTRPTGPNRTTRNTSATMAKRLIRNTRPIRATRLTCTEIALSEPVLTTAMLTRRTCSWTLWPWVESTLVHRVQFQTKSNSVKSKSSSALLDLNLTSLDLVGVFGGLPRATPLKSVESMSGYWWTSHMIERESVE